MSGRGRGRGRDRGRGRATRSPSPATPSSSSSDLDYDAIVFIVGPGCRVVSVVRVCHHPQGRPTRHPRLPDKFVDFVAGNEPAALHLREAGCNCCRWPVDVLFDGRIKIYLHTGWEKFSRYHDLEVGCVLTFSYLGDVDMSVKVFDETRCRRHYHDDTDEEDD
ncbi:hypothetical protein QYE76_055270 [Lolium multiflorum]|uniref:TF-B3 domain-containing protein n=1 Tax=Lolium multiflorum TaxID=4521 RepID=A0AAD8SZE1_LOLMU|nr:hypothetical protein QYE76_055270 [Lolium multiflorum]